jgi:uncharacterized protein YndB with AHSA1/START domain
LDVAVSTASDPLRLRVQIEALPDAVFKALTEPDPMTEWLAESVESTPERYEFWGRYVPRGDRARQRLEALEPGRSVRFTWDLDGGEPSRVDLTVDSSGTVTVVHEAVPADARTELEAFWHLALANLAARCEGLPTTPPLDFTTPAEGEARVRTVISVPPEEVYACLLDAERVGRWAGTTATITPEVGGRYDLGWERGPRAIVELVPDRAVMYSWHHPDVAETVVRWDLRTSHGHTYLTLVHEGFSDDRLAEEMRQRWVPLLVELKRMLEQGPRWQPMAS